MPWLKINGSCPVCRHTLNTDSQNSSSQNDNRSPLSGSPPRQSGGSSGSGWSITGFFSNFGANRGSTSGTSGNRNPGTPSEGNRRGSDTMPPEEDLD